MAIRPTEKYPTQTLAPSDEYPHGQARNQPEPGVPGGTPLEAQWVNDLWGFFQALLAKAGIVPNDSPDTALDSQYLESLIEVARQNVSMQTAFDASFATDGDGLIATDADAVGTSGIKVFRGNFVRSETRLTPFSDQAVVSTEMRVSGVLRSLAFIRAESLGRALLSLRGNDLAILGGDQGTGAPATISVPNGLIIGDGAGHARQYTLHSIRSFTTPGPNVWTRPAGVRAVKVTCVGGGGGGGGGALVIAGAGGGSGAVVMDLVTSPGPTETVTVGEGGSGALGGGGHTAGDGNSSEFGSHLWASGGGGAIQLNEGQGGAAGTIGELRIAGGNGRQGGLEDGKGGDGGSCMYGQGGGWNSQGGSAGSPGSGYGSGGSGGSGNAAGGAGASGLVIVESYI